jgi:hypothetical protein
MKFDAELKPTSWATTVTGSPAPASPMPRAASPDGEIEVLRLRGTDNREVTAD